MNPSPKHQRTHAERGIRSSVDVLVLALTSIFEDDSVRTLTELRETLGRRGITAHRRSIRTALGKMERAGRVSVELLNARCAIYTFEARP